MDQKVLLEEVLTDHLELQELLVKMVPPAILEHQARMDSLDTLDLKENPELQVALVLLDLKDRKENQDITELPEHLDSPEKLDLLGLQD